MSLSTKALKKQLILMEQSETVKEKVLIIAYYWPPAGGPGVQRWLNFANYLSEFGIDPIVYIPENPNYPIIDKTLVSKVSEKITILKQPIDEPYRFAKWFSKSDSKTISSGVIPKKGNQNILQKLLLYVRGNFFIPDARKNWVNPSVAYLTDVIQQLGIKTIITTGPPHSLHLIGLNLKSNCDVRWIADFRDPWTTIGYHKKLKLTKSSRKKHEQLESKVLNSADQLIVTSFHTKKEFSKKANTSIDVITNGYNPYNETKIEKSESFSLAHIGSLLSERNPIALWQALSELISENNKFRDVFKLDLYGIVSEEVLETLENFSLSHFISNHGYVSHSEALIAQRRARVLLLIEIDSDDTKAIIPGKLFEYMVSETPILAIGPNESDVETILYNSSAGNYYSYNQKDLIKTQLMIHFKSYLSGTLVSNSTNIEQYSRKELTKKLANLILKSDS